MKSTLLLYGILYRNVENFDLLFINNLMTLKRIWVYYKGNKLYAIMK